MKNSAAPFERALARVDLAATGSLAQPHGHVHGVAGQLVASLHRIPVADHHQPRVNAGVHGHVEPVRQQRFQVGKPRHLVVQLQRGLGGPARVVFLRVREAENGHHAVAVILVEQPEVLAQHRVRGGFDAMHDLPDHFRVERLAEPGEVAQIREQQRHVRPGGGWETGRLAALHLQGSSQCRMHILLPRPRAERGQ